MVQVAHLAAILNITVLLLASISNRVAARIIKSFATTRLNTERRTPIIHDSDLWLPRIPITIYLYRRHPGILITVLSTVLLLVSELVTELGVAESNMCHPVARTGHVIQPGPVGKDHVTPVEIAAAAYFLQNLVFHAGNLREVSAHFPRRVNQKVCLSCLEKAAMKSGRKPVAEGCTVTEGRVYEVGELKVNVTFTNGTYGTVTSSFLETRTGDPVFDAPESGDLTRGGNHTQTGSKGYCAMFVIVPNPTAVGATMPTTLTYAEYGHQSHCHDLLNRVRTQAEDDPERPFLVEETQSRVYTSRIECDGISLSEANFTLAMQTYRSMQLESTVRYIHFDNRTERFQLITPDDVYRAILAIKLSDDQFDDDVIYYEYTTCAIYRIRYLAPFGVTVTVLAVLALVARLAARRRVLDVGLPYTARGWYGQLRTTHDTRVGFCEDGEFTPDVTHYRRLVRLNEHLSNSRVTHLDDDEAYHHSGETSLGSPARAADSASSADAFWDDEQWPAQQPRQRSRRPWWRRWFRTSLDEVIVLRDEESQQDRIVHTGDGDG